MELRKITNEELAEILRLHKLWLDGKDGGVKADLSYMDLSWKDLSYSDLSHADLSNANLKGANIDCASFSLSCKTLGMITDDYIKIQWLYHAASQKGEIEDKDLNKLYNSDLFIKVCNKFHRIKECGLIKKSES